MARKDKKKTRKVSSLRDVQKLIAMHGEKLGYKTRIHALHGLLHAGSIHKLLNKQIQEKNWIVKGIENLQPLVQAHGPIAASRRLLDEMIGEMTRPQSAPGAAAAALATTAPGASFANPTTAPGASSADPATAPGSSSAGPAAAPGASSADPATAPGASFADSANAPGASPADLANAPGASSADLATAPGAFSADLATAPGASSAEPATAPGASSTKVATALGASSSDSVSAPDAALSDPALAPASAPRMLVLAGQLVEAGAALREVEIDGEFVRVLLHGLGAEISAAGQAILTAGQTHTDTLDNLRQVKYRLSQIWNMRVESKDFNLL